MRQRPNRFFPNPAETKNELAIARIIGTFAVYMIPLGIWKFIEVLIWAIAHVEIIIK